MALSFYTYKDTQLCYPELKSPSKEPKRSDSGYLAASSNTAHLLRSSSSQTGRRIFEGVYLITGLALVAIGILGLYGQIPICGYTSAACLAVGGLLVADGLVSVIIDLIRHFTRPKFKNVNGEGHELAHEIASIRLKMDGKKIDGVWAVKKDEEIGLVIHLFTTKEEYAAKRAKIFD